jgi:hypothetical protein
LPPHLQNSNSIHIVAFDVPFPANYGGVIDIFYKLKALHNQGLNITLHCFEYGRKPATELETLCQKVYYYPRKTFVNFLKGDIPYIVASRESDELLQNLLQDHSPILFEGLHATFYLKHPDLKHRFKIVRTHNVEHDYYHHLEMVEKNFFKRYFFKLESDKLKKYQSVLKHADLICAISPNDTLYFKKKFGKTIFIPAFHANEKVNILESKGNYILYHGNLSVGENHEAANYLINEIFSKLKLPFIIAGNNPKKELKQLVERYENIQLIDDGNTNQIEKLIKNAQINLLYTSQDTGIKLKLLNALFIGRHCIVNHKMADNTGLEDLCHIAETSQEFINLIEEYWQKPIEKEMIAKRKLFFNTHFNNIQSGNQLFDAIPFDMEYDEIIHKKPTKTPKDSTFGISISSLLGILP